MIQREKQITHLTNIVERLSKKCNERISTELPIEANGGEKRREFDNKWTAILDEMNNIKLRNVELNVTSEDLVKENAYLKRALESICTRFQQNPEALITSSKAELKELQPASPRISTLPNFSSVFDGINEKNKELIDMKVMIEGLKHDLTVDVKTSNEVMELRAAIQETIQEVFLFNSNYKNLF